MSQELNDFFTLFGLKPIFLQNSSDIKKNYLKLQQKIHPDNFIDATPAEKRLSIEYAAKINEAYRTLSDPIKRAIVLLSRYGVDVQEETDTSMPMEFLIEQMALRERLAEVSTSNDPIGETQALKNTVDTALKDCEQKLTDYLDGSTLNLSAAKDCVRKMLFYKRMNEEL
ncbi:MAG: Fe-S protein assembly co-chaperone HscB [Candidatus Berkiellales bacterium]